LGVKIRTKSRHSSRRYSFKCGPEYSVLFWKCRRFCRLACCFVDYPSALSKKSIRSLWSDNFPRDARVEKSIAGRKVYRLADVISKEWIYGLHGRDSILLYKNEHIQLTRGGVCGEVKGRARDSNPYRSGERAWERYFCAIKNTVLVGDRK